MIDTISPPLTLADLDSRLRAADPAALLVPPRLLRRIIKHDRALPGIGLQVPHRKCYVIGRDVLFTLAGRDELGVEPDRELPSKVLLLPRPDPHWLIEQSPGVVLVKYWRLLFHTAIHRAIAARDFSPVEIRARVRQIGHAAFDEIRTVLRQERFLLPPEDDASIYEEFAGLYLDLATFARPLLRHYFSSIDDFERVGQSVMADVDGPALLAATRPAGAPEPTAVLDTSDRDQQELCVPDGGGGHRTISPNESRKYAALAEKVALTGNDVRAAIRFTQAARLAPGNRVAAVRAAAETEIQKLVKRMRPALALSSAEAAAWRQALPALLPPASRGIWPAEARLLYDLQKVCVDHERPVSAPHPGEWVYSGFTKPFVLPLPDQPIVMAVKRLRRAAGRLPSVRLSDADRQTLEALLSAALLRAEAQLRERFRPRLVAALDGVALIPANYPERVSRDKLIEELLDIIAARGYLTQPDLRDALSRNQVKLPDLTGPRELFAGDPLLRANRDLAVSMPGVYRRGEVYLRWLQRLSAALFGTVTGRWLSLNVFAPFGGAFLAIEGPLQVGHELSKLFHYVFRLIGVIEALPPDHVKHPVPFPLAPWPAILIVGVFFWLLMHVRPVRGVTVNVLGAIGHVMRFALIDAPTALFRWRILRAVLDSPPARMLARFALKPLLPAAVTWIILVEWQSGTRMAAIGGAIVYSACVLFLGTHLSHEFEEATADWAIRRWEFVRDFLPGLFRFIVDAFKRLMEGIDRGLYAVDEWLRFRGGETQTSRILKTVGGLLWGGVAYFLRFLIVLFIEPQINPIKHFPVVTISHKLLLPMIPSLQGVFETSFGFGAWGAGVLATIIIGKIPGIFGFLVWEFKENWRLYKANRPTNLQPVMIGHHGETLPRLLRPGFHSGTLPKLYSKLRRAERRAIKSCDWRAVRRHLETLDHNVEALHRFAERDLLAYVNGTPAWSRRPLRLIAVDAGANRVRIELACPAAGPGRLIVTYDELSGWLVAGAADPHWRIHADQMAILELALAGLDKVGGADILRADVESALGTPTPPYDLTEAGLIVWPDSDTEVVYNLDAEPTISPRVTAGKLPDLPPVDSDRLLFRRRPMPWTGWVAAWEQVMGPTEA